MQQVGARIFADAQAALEVTRHPHDRFNDPRHLPAPLPHPQRSLQRQALIAVSHAWVLHRQLLVRIAGGLLALGAATALLLRRRPPAKRRGGDTQRPTR